MATKKQSDIIVKLIERRSSLLGDFLIESVQQKLCYIIIFSGLTKQEITDSSFEQHIELSESQTIILHDFERETRIQQQQRLHSFNTSKIEQTYRSSRHTSEATKMRIIYRESVLIALVSLLVVHDTATAFIPSARRQPSSHSNIHTDMDCNSGCEQDVRISTRLFATPPSSSDNKLTTTTSTNNRNDKSTTELRAATGISLSSTSPTPSIASQTETDDSSNSGLGVLFLNLGGPTTGDDVEGTSRG